MRSPCTRRLPRPQHATRAARFAPAGHTIFAAIVAASILLTACVDSTASSPATATQPTAKPNPQPAPPPPPTINGPSALYRRTTPATYGSDAYALSLGADSAFVIIFPQGDRYWGWAGRYERADSVVVFHYNAWSAAGDLSARATIRGDTLLLRYNSIMQMTDFEDGVYVRDRSAP